MAAREHQGLQIALFIFVVLTIVLGVTSFWFFDKFKNEREKGVAYSKERDKAATDQKVAVENLERVKRFLNFGPRDEVGAMEARYNKDMDTYGKTFPQANQNYPFVVAELDKQRKAKDAELIDASARERVLEAKIDKDEEAKTAELATYNAGLDKSKEDASGEREKFNKDRKTLKDADVEIARKLADKLKEVTDISDKSVKDLEVLYKRIADLTKTNEVLVTKDKEDKLTSERPDGKVTWVNQRAHIVWLNLGAEDGLKRQVSFSVQGPDENNPLKANHKGSVEVTRVLDRHLAEARIIEDQNSDPIMPGDSVFSVAWQPGRSEHFAIAGLTDMDKDGVSDRQRVRDLITLNGGIIDAEVDDNGKRTGELTVNTRYLVLGDKPSEKTNKTDLLPNWAEIQREAKSLPIRTISVAELMDYLGYEARERTIPLGADSNAADFRPREPEGSRRKSTNNMFKPRRDAPTGGVKSAY